MVVVVDSLAVCSNIVVSGIAVGLILGIAARRPTRAKCHLKAVHTVTNESAG